MVTRNTPPAYGLSGGPIIVACQWNISSATGPGVHQQQPASKTTVTIYHNKYHSEVKLQSISDKPTFDSYSRDISELN